MARRLILDAGGIIAAVLGDRRAVALLQAARLDKRPVVIPPSVLTQVVRGRRADAAIHHLVKRADVPAVGLRLARRAGELLGTCGVDDAVDAQVMVEALRAGPATLLTSDPADMKALAGAHAGRAVVIVAV